MGIDHFFQGIDVERIDEQLVRDTIVPRVEVAGAAIVFEYDTASAIRGITLDDDFFSDLDCLFGSECGLHVSSSNVKEHAPLSAGAGVDHGVEVETTSGHENRAADRGCCVSTCWASSFFIVEFMKLLNDPDKLPPFRGKGVNCSRGCLVKFLLVE